MLLKDRKVIVTGGPTREWFDPVRFISNPSSGKMGVALADESFGRFGETVFIHGPIHKSLVKGKPYRTIGIETTEDMLKSVLDELKDYSVLIMAAAPADFTPAEKFDEKIKKSENDFLVKLKRTPDILKTVSEKRDSANCRGLFLAGFAAETSRIEERAVDKLIKKNIDMICLNDVSENDIGFGTDINRVKIFFREGPPLELPLLTKHETARNIIDSIEKKLLKRR